MARKRSLLVLGIMALLISACAGQAAPTPTLESGRPTAVPTPTATPRIAPPAAPAKLKIQMMIPTDTPHLDRVELTSAPGEPIWENILEPLVRIDKAGKPVPILATRWESSADLTKWRFYLRRGVKFHNGADFTARDVVETVKYLLDIRKASFLYARVRIAGAIAVDDHTVDLVFADLQPLLPLTIRSLLIYPVAVARDNRAMAKTSVIGTGPYRFVEWRPGIHAKLAKFEDYWGSKPQISDAQIVFRKEEGVRLAALRVAEAQWVSELQPESASRAPKVVQSPSPETVWLRFDEYILKELGGESTFADKRLRLAVEHAIDRQALVALYQGLATPSLGQFASPGEFGFNLDLKSRPYDLQKARALVKEAGAVGKTISFAGQAGRFAKDREVSEAVAYMIEQTGLKVKLMLLDRNEHTKYIKVTDDNRTYMTDIVFNTSDALLEVETRFPKIFVEGEVHFALNDREPTRLFKEEQAELDLTERGEKLAKAWAYVYEQAHYVPLYKFPWIWGLAKNLEWQPPLTGIPYIADMTFND